MLRTTALTIRVNSHELAVDVDELLATLSQFLLNKITKLSNVHLLETTGAERFGLLESVDVKLS
jgi:hypothetical protein